MVLQKTESTMANTLVYVCAAFCFIEFVFASEETNTDYNEISRGLNARTLLEKITSTFMTRSDGSSSQVLSLNLSNLLILVLLKALIFAAGSIGAGANGWKGGYGYGHGRSSEEDRLVSDTEILLYLSYLAGSPGKYQCLQNVACNRPQQAMQYAKAGGLLMKAARFMPNVVELDPNHEQTLVDLRKAAEFGQGGGNCDAEYVCASNRKK